MRPGNSHVSFARSTCESKQGCGSSDNRKHSARLKHWKNMADDNDKTLRALHDLAATCNDAAEGYAKAAKAVHDTDFSDWLAAVSNKREQFSADIENAIRNLGGESREDLHQGGILHGGWVDLEKRLRPKDEQEVVQNCITGDTGTLKHYDHTLAQSLSPEMRSLVQGQMAAVQEDLASLRGRASHAKAQNA
jgi:uncharacterized protein (TIGR02284 family)